VTEYGARLEAIGVLTGLFAQHEIDYWLFGGWAVDFHVGRVTRRHADIDIAVWAADLSRIEDLLGHAGWHRTRHTDEDGYAEFAHGTDALDLAFLARDDDGLVYTPLEDGRGEWPVGTFGDDVATLHGVQARVVRAASLLEDNSQHRDDPSTRAKDEADVAALLQLRHDP